MEARIIKPIFKSKNLKWSDFCIISLSGLLWLYFLLPLFTLAGWLVGFKHLSTEIRWFGGYKTLLELLQMYGLCILVIALAWFFWTMFTSWWKPALLPAHLKVVEDNQLCVAFGICSEQLKLNRTAKISTVSFDSSGQIVSILETQVASINTSVMTDPNGGFSTLPVPAYDEPF